MYMQFRRIYNKLMIYVFKSYIVCVSLNFYQKNMHSKDFNEKAKNIGKNYIVEIVKVHTLEF